MWILWATFAIAATAEKTQIVDTLTPLPGAIREDIGITYPVTEAIKIIYDTSPYVHLTKIIGEQRKSLIDIELHIQGDGYIEQRQKDLLLEAIETMKFRMDTAIGNNTQERNNRTKRGLIDIVGTAAHTLFGIVNDDTLQGKLKEYDEQIKTVTNTYEASSRQINKVIRNVNKLEQDFNKLNKNRPTFEANRFAHYAFQIHSYQTTLTDTIQAKTNLQRTLEQAALGNIEPSLITPHDLKKVIERMHIKQVRKPLFPIHNTALFYATLRGYITHEGLTIILPLRPTEIYRTYNVHPFPQQLNASETIVTLHSKPLILIDMNSHKVVTPTEPLTKLCTSPRERIYICLKQTWAQHKIGNTCERAIVGNVNSIHSLCSFNVHKAQTTPFLLPTTQSTILYFYTPTATTITCTTTQPMTVIEGPYTLPHECSLNTLSLSLPATHTYTTTFTKNITVPTPTPFKAFPIHKIQHDLTYTFETMDELPLTPWSFPKRATIDFIYPVAVTIIGLIGSFFLFRIFVHYARKRHMSEHPPAYTQ